MRGLITLAARIKRDKIESYKDKIKICFLGTAPIDMSTKQRFQELFGIVPLENFALSETTFITSETLNDINNRVENSVGEILPYIDIKFQPVTNEENSSHTEIYVKSPFLFLGYLQEDGTVNSPLDKDGYLPTGDLGYLNDHNTLFISGRSRDIIKKGGYFVPLREVEILAQQHDDVSEAIAVKTIHEFYGESYLLFIKANYNTESNLQSEFSSWLHKNLVQYKWPEKIVFVEDFPRTASGKVRKHLLIKQGV
jgi:acyl-CoA synthetase (AMP-forming)/AMP-acid ligase II